MRPASVPACGTWLSLAAAPVLAAMALLTALGGRDDVAMCLTSHAGWSGMAPMYLLMSAFHAAPWLEKLFTPARS
jgi:hypothetical protein